MNSKSMFVALVVCGLFLAAVLARNGEVLLLAMPFLAYLIVGAVRCPDNTHLRALRTIAKSAVVSQEPVKVQVLVENHGKELPNVLLCDPLAAGMTIVEGQARQRLALASAAAKPLEYVATGERGLYKCGTLHVIASDPCGLFEFKSEIPCSGELCVRPAAMRFRQVAIRPRSTLHAPGPTPARLAGAGTDFWGIREYRVGDPLRRLNWRLAGRYPQRLFTNEYQGEEITDFGLILDTRRLTDAYGAAEALFEACTSAAASLSEIFLKQGNRVALLVFGEAPTCLYPGYGKRQLNLILRDLARATLSRNLPSRYLEYFPAQLFPSRAVLLVFSVLDTGDEETYRRLRSFGYEVLLISPDPIEYAGRTLPPTRVNDLAVRAARLERVMQLTAIMKMGVSVIDWQVDQPLDTILRNTTRDMIHRRNL